MAMIPVTKVEFANPEEGVTAALERLATASAHYEVARTGAVHALIDLSLLACGSDKSVALSVPVRALEVLEKAGVLGWSKTGTVVLL